MDHGNRVGGLDKDYGTYKSGVAPSNEGLGWDPQLQMLIILVVTVILGGGPHPTYKHINSDLGRAVYQTPPRQQVNGSGTFDEILSNHSPGFTMSRVTSPKFLFRAVSLEGRGFD